MSDWRAVAACHDWPADLFFPDGAGRPAIPSCCGSCPVSSECLAWALEHNECGIWGGTTDKQRRRMSLRQRRTKPPAGCGTDAGYRRHRYLREAPCEACSAAHASYEHDRRLRNRELVA